MKQLTWHMQHITTNKQANILFLTLPDPKTVIAAFDTETRGLNIVLDTPFVYVFGYADPVAKTGFAFALDLEKQPALSHAVIDKWQEWVQQVPVYLGHNIKFDLHMMRNIGQPYRTENMVDTMFCIRYAHNAVQEEFGGPPLGLKPYSVRFIDRTAGDLDKLVQSQRSAIAKDLNVRLKQALKGMLPPEQFGKSWTLGLLYNLFKDPTFEFREVDEAAEAVYQTWLNTTVPECMRWQVTGLVSTDLVPYTLVNRTLLINYAMHDIVYTIETYLKTWPVVEARCNQLAVEIECKDILPLLDMEAVGFRTNRTYLEQVKTDMKDYIRQRRQDMYALAGEEVSVSQHARIKEILTGWGIEVEGTGAEVLDLLTTDLIREDETRWQTAIAFIAVVQELRTLEKWYSTYLLRFLNNLKRSDRLYTTINQVGAVSGRVTSDFQQFPKKGIKTVDGKELFHPRRAIIPTGGDYNALVYLDYSQIELRLQAVYTILVGSPDLNLCRAYMPYRCRNKHGELFDYNNPAHLASWQDDWYREEDLCKWEPTDLHGATTTTATGLTPEHPEFKTLRTTVGKRTNFAKQYGAQLDRIRRMFPRLSEAEVKRIDGAYYKTFPGVRAYHQYCYEAADLSFVENLDGVRYYGASGHKLINMLIQGSAAFFLKRKIRELWEYAQTHNIKSRYQMNIHDENSWERYKGETDIFFIYQRIMSDWPGLPVPIVAEMEVTTTTWAEKRGCKNLEELHTYLGD
jgi:DNA polymerase-1